jgi:hypothetical protein
MPISKHGRKGLTSRQWRKRRNNRQASQREQGLAEKRGMKKAMEIMQEQYQSDKDLASLLPENPLEAK